MNNMLTMLEAMIPEGIESFKIRYTLLQLLRDNQPIGRRGLSALTTYSERAVRTSIEVLSRQGLVEVAHKGMIVTDKGIDTLIAFSNHFYELQRHTQMEQELKEKLRAKRVLVVEGDTDEHTQVKWNIGQVAARLLPEIVADHDTVAITGGSTIAKMMEALEILDKKNVTVIPARGNIGKRVEFQATSIAAALASKMSGKYEVLSVPDNLSKDSIETIKQDPQIEKTLKKLSESDMIILGLGNAMKMAKRRNENEQTLKLLDEKEAVAEVFRYYFDRDGQVVYSTDNIGIDLADAMKIPKKVILAGGKSKATAILAIKTLIVGSYLIIDEGIAKEILSNIL